MKGADAAIFNVLRTSIEQGRDDITILELSLQSGYSTSSVQLAIARLERMHMISVVRGGSRRPNRYRILSQRPQIQRMFAGAWDVLA
jgi:DNA-binding MarR family transcriptional regulator